MAVGSLSGGGRGSGRRRRGKNVCQTAGQSKKLIRMPSGSECTRATLFFSCTAGAGAMSKELSRSVAFNNISSWDTEEVLKLLRKNGLEECCKAVGKRQIDGDELLHLTDGKLALWKNDLTRPLMGKLWAFVQELNQTPEKYLPDKATDVQQNDDHSNDSDSWGTDFEDEMPEENSHVEDTQKEVAKPNLIKSRQALLLNNNIQISMRIPPLKKTANLKQEETYANSESSQDNEENMYQNFQEMRPSLPRNISRLHNEMQKSSAAKENKKESEHSNELSVGKPVIGPKPEALSRKIAIFSDRKPPQKSFLHNPPKINQCVPKEITKRMAVPPPPEPEHSKNYKSVEIKRSEKELPKPPATIRNFDLVKDLPAPTEESEDEYETFEDNIIEQPKTEIMRVDSKLSLQSGRQGSVESVYKPPSAASHEEEEEEYEIYECITEMPEENGYLSPIQRTNHFQSPPPLPVKPITPPLTPLNQRTRSERLRERSPEKKSATLPHSSNNNLLSNDRATRPLPPPPDRHSYMDKPWFHNVTREQANMLIKDPSTYTNPPDGYFLLRPSTTNVGNPLALVLWYNDRVYNVPVRKRSDNRYALGSPKLNEQSFLTIEEIVMFYMREELVLHTGGIQTGSTKLTDTPPK